MTCHHGTGQMLAGGLALFSFGLVGSLHCMGMCGPLSSLIATGPKVGRLLGGYHAGRLLAYASLGALLAWLGSPLQAWLPWPWLPLLWALPLLYFSMRPAQAPAWMADLHRRAAPALARFSPLTRAFGFGLLTPLLPCGLLYGAAASALAAPHAWTAAAWMAAFALGSAPGLLLGQKTLLWLGQARTGPWAQRLQRVSAAITALLVLYLSRPG